MKIVLFIDDSGYKNVDLTTPNDGNPGVGGTQYCFAMLLYNYQRFYPNKYDFYLIHTENTNIYPKTAGTYVIKALNEIEKPLILIKGNLLIIWSDSIDTYLINVIKNLNYYLISWAHNFVNYNFLKIFYEDNNCFRNVFVGQEEYDKYCDDNCIKKSVVIENMVSCNFTRNTKTQKNNHNLVYVGALLPQKGFHILAEIWNDILKKVPDAQLFVCGNGRLYNRNNSLGEYGISTKEYEDIFMPFLTKDGQIINSVHFLGNIGDKAEIFNNARVGVVNPSGISETLCISALEMQLCNVPVVSIKKKGLLDGIGDGYSGLLCKNKNELADAIVSVLKDDFLWSKLSNNGPIFIRNKFDLKTLVKKWDLLFTDFVNHKRTVKFHASYKHLCHNLKIIKLLNHYMRFIFPFIPSSSKISYLKNNR